MTWATDSSSNYKQLRRLATALATWHQIYNIGSEEMYKKIIISRAKLYCMGDVVRFNVYADGKYVGTTTILKPKLTMIHREWNGEYFLQFRNDSTYFSMFCNEVVLE